MNKKNILFGLLTTILIICISLLLILEFTVFNRKYIINILEKNNYYNEVYKETQNTINSYIISSGIDKSTFNDIFTIDDIKYNVNNYIDYLYVNKELKLNNDTIKSNINNNINTYLDKYNIKLDSTKEVDDLVNEIVKIYENETIFYKKMDNFTKILKKVKKIVEITLIILVLTLTLLLIVLKSNIVNFFSSSLMSSGILVLFIKYILYDKIKYSNILIISESFSNILNIYLRKLGNIIIISGVLLIIISIIVMFKEIKRSKVYGRD